MLHRFGIMDFKSMTTPIVSNLKKPHESDYGSDLMDTSIYIQLIGSLMYLIHYRPDICNLYCEYLELVHV